MKTTRRDLLRGTAGTVAIAAVGSVATVAATIHTDPILSLERQLWEADEASGSLETAEEDAAHERAQVLDKQMQDAVPVSLAGVAAKLRYLKWDASKAGGPQGERAAATALEGLEALIEGRQL